MTQHGLIELRALKLPCIERHFGGTTGRVRPNAWEESGTCSLQRRFLAERLANRTWPGTDAIGAESGPRRSLKNHCNSTVDLC